MSILDYCTHCGQWVGGAAQCCSEYDGSTYKADVPEASKLEEYLKDEDPNKFWRLSSGEHENLLDLALESAEDNKENLKKTIKIVYKLSMEIQGQEKTIGSLISVAMEATQDLALYGNDDYDYERIGAYHKKIEELTA